MTNQEIIQAIRDLSNGKPISTDITSVLRKHRCDNLLNKQQKESHDPSNRPTHVLNTLVLKERFEAYKPLFEQNEISYAVIKGAVLSQALYKNPHIRFSGDIDILIHRRDADSIKQLLHANGFIQGRVTETGIIPFTRKELLFQATMTHQTAPYIKETGNKLYPYVNLDVNMEILWGESEEKADMDYVLSNIETSNLFNISFQKLSSEMEFVSLCLHHYKDLNSIYLLTQGSFRLGLFCEIYDYLRNVRLDTAKLFKIATHLKIAQYLYVCIYQTKLIFEDPLLDNYIDLFQLYRNDILIESFGLNEKERKSWNIPLFERLFHNNLPEYILQQLTDGEKEKIKTNQNMM